MANADNLGLSDVSLLLTYLLGGGTDATSKYGITTYIRVVGTYWVKRDLISWILTSYAKK